MDLNQDEEAIDFMNNYLYSYIPAVYLFALGDT
jgi:hypothetical protein